MSFTEKIVVGKIFVKVMHSGKVMCIAFTENSFKVMRECDNKQKLWLQIVSLVIICGPLSERISRISTSTWSTGTPAFLATFASLEGLSLTWFEGHLYLKITIFAYSPFFQGWKGIWNVRFSIYSTFQEKHKTISKLEFWFYIKKL